MIDDNFLTFKICNILIIYKFFRAIEKPPHQETKADLDDASGSLEDIEMILKKIEISATKNQTSLSSSRYLDIFLLRNLSI